MASSSDVFVVIVGAGDFSAGWEYKWREFIALLWDAVLPNGMVVVGGDDRWTVAPYWHKCPKRPDCDKWRQFLIGSSETITPTGVNGASVRARRRVKKR